MQNSTASSILMDTLGGTDGSSGIRDAINKMIVGFIPYHDHPYFKYVLIGIGIFIVLWITIWYWYNFLR